MRSMRSAREVTTPKIGGDPAEETGPNTWLTLRLPPHSKYQGLFQRALFLEKSIVFPW